MSLEDQRIKNRNRMRARRYAARARGVCVETGCGKRHNGKYLRCLACRKKQAEDYAKGKTNEATQP